MKLDLTDLLILVGAAVIGVGLYLWDWRATVVWAGVLIMAAGLARLPRR